jgi:hypothetical protein
VIDAPKTNRAVPPRAQVRGETVIAAMNTGDADVLVEGTVAALNAICKAATLDFAVSVGDCVIRRVYAGDMTRWRERDPSKEVSLRKLVRHPHMPMSAASLYRCIAIYEICSRMGVHTWAHVSSSHIRLVLPLAPDDQNRLLLLTESERWSVRRLDAEIAHLRRTHAATCSERGGRQRRTPLDEIARAVDRGTRLVAESLEKGDYALSVYERKRTAIALLAAAVHAFGALEQRLRDDLSGDDSQPNPQAIKRHETATVEAPSTTRHG